MTLSDPLVQRVVIFILSKHDNWACSQEKEVPCWVPRPWEKRIFLHYMLFIQLFSIVIILFGTFSFQNHPILILKCNIHTISRYFEENFVRFDLCCPKNWYKETSKTPRTKEIVTIVSFPFFEK